MSRKKRRERNRASRESLQQARALSAQAHAERDEPNLTPEQELGVGMSLNARKAMEHDETTVITREGVLDGTVPVGSTGVIDADAARDLLAKGTEQDPAIIRALESAVEGKRVRITVKGVHGDAVDLEVEEEEPRPYDTIIEYVAPDGSVQRWFGGPEPGVKAEDWRLPGDSVDIDPKMAANILREGFSRRSDVKTALQNVAAGKAKMKMRYLSDEEARHERRMTAIGEKSPALELALRAEYDRAVGAQEIRTDEGKEWWRRKAIPTYQQENLLDGLSAAVMRAELKGIKEAVENDNDLMARLREQGTTLTFADVPGRKARDRNLPKEVRARLLSADPGGNLPRSWGRADGLPKIRRLMLAHLEFEEYKGAAWRPLPIAPEHAWKMFFATKDFADLYEQMHQDFTEERLEDYVRDIMEAWGTSGQIVVGFDAERYPEVHWSNVYNDSTPEVMVEPDPWVKEAGPFQIATVGAMTFQWATPEDQHTRLYVGYRSRGDSFRTSVWSSPSTQEGILMAWMLANPALGFLESKPQQAAKGLPPRVKDEMPRKDRTAEVVVVSLRKRVRKEVDAIQAAQSAAKGSSGRHLHFRFLVRGHYKNQAYGPGRTLRRRIYVMPFVKGPEGAPFIERERVYQW